MDDRNAQSGSGSPGHHEHRITNPAGTQIQVRLDQEVRAQGAQQGDTVRATLVHELVVDGTGIAPAGSHVQLRVIDKAPGRPEPLSIRLTSLHTDRGQ